MLIVILLFSFEAREQYSLRHTSSPIVTEPLEISPDFYFSVSNKKHLTAALQRYFNQAIDNGDIVGASVAIVKCDSVLYAGGYGHRSSVTKEKINEETIFRIGSASKGFAGVLAGIHVEEGLIDWGDKVMSYMPDFELPNKQQTENITISHILSHTTGLPYHSFTNLVEDGISINEIASSFKEVDPIGKPGAIYSYQNAIFALSGAIVEQVTGTSLREVMQKKIFDPLAMSSASTSYEALELSDNVAQPHKKYINGWQPIPINNKYYTNAIAAGGVNASAVDMSKWMKFLLGNNPEVLMPTSMQEVFTPKIEVGGRSKYYQKWPNYISSSYGYGWRIHTFVNEGSQKPATIIHHGGSVNDYRTEIAIYPEEDLGICVLFNSQNKLARTCVPDLHKIIQEIMNTSSYDEVLKESLSVL